MFTLAEIRQHFDLTNNHLAAVSALRAYQGFTWIDAFHAVKQWRHERKCAIRTMEESKKIAALAVRAAKNRKIWGDYATNRFIKKNNIPARVQTLAYKLEMAKQSTEKQASKFFKNGKYVGLLAERTV